MTNRKAENDEDGQEELLEEICENGEPVFCMFWGSGAPGAGADCEIVYYWNGSYAVSSSSEDLLGPYDSLNAALRENDGLLRVTPATERIECESMSGKAIAAMLRSEADKPLTFKINGEKWKYERASGFRMA